MGFDSDKIKEAIKRSVIKHDVLILADDKKQLIKYMNKIKKINNKKYEIYNEVFNNKKDQTSLFYEDVTFSGVTTQNLTRLRCLRVDQIIYVGSKSLWEFEIGRHILGMVMRDALSRSCVPEEFQIQKWEL
jgi:hypothetical protein